MNLSSRITDFPAYQIADALNRHLQVHNTMVVTAPPGAGKSTILPLTILDSLPEGKIILLEPRRIAARQVAIRMAELLGEEVGETVGYRVRYETRVSRKTRLEVVTEGILTRMLIEDATLDDVRVVIFDEFHERSIHSDLSLALTRETQSVLRDDLRLIIMSATIDTDKIAAALSAPVLHSKGYIYPVDIQYTPIDRPTPESIARLVLQAHRAEEGDILVFLPGQWEIDRCAELLSTAFKDTAVCPLYGALSIAEQQRAIMPDRNGKRKVVLATNIAETSLTIEGIRVVIDSGMHRTLVYDQRTCLSHLETKMISLDMANQRSGRAGRLAPGICYRLWSKATEARMAECRTPEILEADLVPLVLDIATWQGAATALTIQQLPWMTPPPAAKIAQAIETLTLLGALDSEGKITPFGRQLSTLPCHPRIAAMLLRAGSKENQSMACRVAAELETAGKGDVKRATAEYLRIMKIACEIMPGPHERGMFIASAFPERIYLSGNTLMVDANGESYPVRREDITQLIHTFERLQWDSRQGCVVAQSEQYVGRQLIQTKPLTGVDRSHVIAIMAEAAKKDGLSMFDFTDAVTNMQQRVATVAAWHPELELPDLSTVAVLDRADEWLPMFAGQANSSAELRKIDLCSVLWSLLSYEQQQAVERLAPTHIEVPTGSRIRVEYRVGAEHPVLRVRLQECFGLTDTPCVDEGRRPVLMELLSPGFKPVQLTQDLRSFWSRTYFEVRSELRRRYPKHAWPEDPLSAPPARGVKRC